MYEILGRREENVKHFRLGDGSFVALQYDAPVHYLDADGAWQEIDNRLAEDGSEYATSDARIKFAKKITGNETLFTLHDGNGTACGYDTVAENGESYAPVLPDFVPGYFLGGQIRSM